MMKKIVLFCMFVTADCLASGVPHYLKVVAAVQNNKKNEDHVIMWQKAKRKGIPLSKL